MQTSKCHKHDKFYNRVNFKACWEHKKSISAQPGEMKASMLEQNFQNRDIRREVGFPGWKNHTACDSETVVQEADCHLVSCEW